MDAKTLRTENIRAIVDEYGGPTAFANRSNGRWDQGQVSQWTSRTKPKPIGHALARSIEEALGKPRGWLDREHPKGAKYLPKTAANRVEEGGKASYTASQPAGLDVETLLMVLEELEIAIARARVPLAPELKARVILTLYLQHAAGAVDPADRVANALATILSAIQEQKA